MRIAPVLVLLVLLAITGPLGAEDEATRNWPQWRGPGADGVAPYAEPPLRWSEVKNVAWKAEIPGRGQSSPIVWGDYVFLTTAVGVVEAPQSRQLPDPEGRGRHPMVSPSSKVQQFRLLALKRADGGVAWSRTLRQELPHDGIHLNGSYATPSPLTDGELVFAHFGSRGLYALTLAGRKVWELDLGDMTIRRGFGEGSSPALQGDTLVVTWDHQGDSFIVALDRTTGREKWRTPREEITSWTTPLIVESGGRYQVVTSATERVRSYDLETGGLLWESRGVTLNAIPSPVAAKGVVFITSGYRGSVLYAVQLDRARGDLASGDAIVWSGDRDTPYVPSPLLYDGTLYLIKSNSGNLSAFDANSGERHYLERLDDVPRVYASPVAAGGRVYIPGRDGGTLVLAAGPEFEVLAFNELDDGFDASPAVVASEIYLRGSRWLYRISE